MVDLSYSSANPSTDRNLSVISACGVLSKVTFRVKFAAVVQVTDAAFDSPPF